MKNENTKIIKEKIEKYEWNRGWYKKVGGAYLEVKNLRIRKDKYIADVVYKNDLNKESEGYYDIEYPKKIIDELLVR